MTIGKRISELRKQKRLSQETLAEELNVSRQAVSKWENDQAVPDMENLLALAELLDADLMYLAYGVESTQKIDAVTKSEVKPKKIWIKRLICILLVCAIGFGTYCYGLWLERSARMQEIEHLCTYYAGECLDGLSRYQDSQDERFYWYAVGDFRAFMECYYQIVDGTDDSYIYVDMNEVYAYLVSKPELSRLYLKEVTAFLESFQNNLYDVNAVGELMHCRNALHQAD